MSQPLIIIKLFEKGLCGVNRQNIQVEFIRSNYEISSSSI